ncbi:SAF domain-containing protein [Kitasatospora sp. LaBMicrA B282]|uniref:SAF domain-containing protein n=1 Tax=Kitasatospora sp. LaBMicrA B282 TaxID=3420949 RepID=UPI003D12EF76
MVQLRIPSARDRRATSGVPAVAGEKVRIAAVKRRDRLRLFTGLAVMVVCALMFGALAIATGHRSQVLLLARPVVAGQVLTADDVRPVLLSAEAGAATVPAARRDEVVGRRVNASLPAGLLLSEGLLGQGPTAPGTAVVPLALKEGRYPPILDAGDRVAVYEAHPATTPGGAGAPASAAAGVEAMTIDVRPAGGSSDEAVATLQVPTAQAGRLVALQEPAVVLLGSAGADGEH